MHLSIFKKSSLITFLFATAIVTGQETPSTLQQQDAEMPMTEENTMVPGYNASCRINVQRSYDFFISGSFTYWQPIQENMKLGVISNTTNPLDLVNGDEVDLDFDYKPGFKVGLGMNFDYDKWDTFIEYTWFRGTEQVDVNLDPNNTQVNLLPAWQIPNFLNPEYNIGSEKWKLRMDLIDWDLARCYNVGTELCFHPFLGLRGAIINQSIRVDYINITPSDLATWPSTFIHQTSDSWGIGPRVGLSLNWNLGKGFRLYGNGEMDILFTQYDLKSTQTSAVTVANRYIVNQNNANYLREHAELDLGLGWGTYFLSNQYHIDFSADYGFQVFFDQNMFRSIASAQAVGKSTMPNGNLYIQGLTVSVRFDF
ncbi:MAG: hypothetical protein HY860_00815 [Chlamydiales bacterium]|nr:hypothetical protein [Chlamydiales bacterium]